MERMLAREHVELPRQQWVFTDGTAISLLHCYESVLQICDILLDRFGAARGFVHFGLERVDMSTVALECGANLFLEIVDDDEVGKEREDVLDLESGRVV
jgi:hypothetical protein